MQIYYIFHWVVLKDKCRVCEELVGMCAEGLHDKTRQFLRTEILKGYKLFAHYRIIIDLRCINKGVYVIKPIVIWDTFDCNFDYFITLLHQFFYQRSINLFRISQRDCFFYPSNQMQAPVFILISCIARMDLQNIMWLTSKHSFFD